MLGNIEIKRIMSEGGVLWEKEPPWKNIKITAFDMSTKILKYIDSPEMVNQPFKVMEIKTDIVFHKKHNVEYSLIDVRDKDGNPVHYIAETDIETGIARITCERPAIYSGSPQIIIKPQTQIIFIMSGIKDVEQFNQDSQFQYRIIE